MKKEQSIFRKMKRGHLFTKEKEINIQDPITKKEKTVTILETYRRSKRGKHQLVNSKEIKK